MARRRAKGAEATPTRLAPSCCARGSGRGSDRYGIIARCRSPYARWRPTKSRSSSSDVPSGRAARRPRRPRRRGPAERDISRASSSVKLGSSEFPDLLPNRPRHQWGLRCGRPMTMSSVVFFFVRSCAPGRRTRVTRSGGRSVGRLRTELHDAPTFAAERCPAARGDDRARASTRSALTRTRSRRRRSIRSGCFRFRNRRWRRQRRSPRSRR